MKIDEEDNKMRIAYALFVAAVSFFMLLVTQGVFTIESTEIISYGINNWDSPVGEGSDEFGK